jgi:hypothetical protein
LSKLYLLHIWRDSNEISYKCLPLWKTVSCAWTRSLGQMSRSHLEVIENTSPEQNCTCIKGFQYNLTQMFTIVKRMSRAKFRALQPKSTSHLGVKVQIIIRKCVFAPFIKHLLRDWNKNSHYHNHQYYHNHRFGTCNFG